MSFRPLVARAGAAATAGAAVFNQNAKARAPPLRQDVQQHVGDSSKNKLEDEWTMAQFDMGEVVFRPEEISEAAADFRQATYGIRFVEDREDTSSNDSDDQRATEIIELSESMHVAPAGQQTTYVNSQRIDMLLDLATEMLKRPKIQQEVMSVIADNPCLRNFLIQPSPPITAAQQMLLLEAPPAPAADQEGEEEGGEDIWGEMLSQLQHTLSKMGSGLDGIRHRLGHFLRVLLWGPDRKAGMAAVSSSKSGTADGAGAPAGGEGGMHHMLRAAMAVAVVLVCLAITRRPGVAAAVVALAASRPGRT